MTSVLNPYDAPPFWTGEWKPDRSIQLLGVAPAVAQVVIPPAIPPVTPGWAVKLLGSEALVPLSRDLMPHIQRSPSAALEAQQQATQLLQASQLQPAFMASLKAISADPLNEKSYGLLAQALHQLNQLEAAFYHVLLLTFIKPNQDNYLKMAQTLALKLQEPGMALGLLAKRHKLTPDNSFVELANQLKTTVTPEHRRLNFEMLQLGCNPHKGYRLGIINYPFKS
jgi:hypothetical protein